MDKLITERKSGQYEHSMSAIIQIMTVQKALVTWYSCGISAGGQGHEHAR